MEQMKYSPEEFLGDTPPPRIMGSESEYDARIYSAEHQRTTTADEFLAQIITNPNTYETPKLQNLRIKPPINPNSHTVFMSNGAKFYRDCGYFAEYATPESLGAADMAYQDYKAYEIFAEILTKRQEEVALFNNTGRYNDTYLTTSGYHVNLLMHESTRHNPQLKALLSSGLATLLPITGGGLPARSPYDTQYISQKSQHIATIEGNMNNRTGARKPVYMIHPNDSASYNETSNDEWPRLEIRALDMPLSPWVKWLGAAAIDLMLKVVERPQYYERNIGRLAIKQPLQSFQRAASDITLYRKYLTEDNTNISATDHGQVWLNCIEKMSQDVALQPDLQLAITEWRQILDDLDRYSREKNLLLISDRLDWPAKLISMQRAHIRPEDNHAENPNAIQFHDNWHKIYKPGMGVRLWRLRAAKLYAQGKLPFDLSQITQDDIITRPPETRAKWRSEAIEQNPDIRNIRWNKYTLPNLETITNNDPYATEK